ncbi:MAG TPA: glutaredoxin family protein [Candidatus Methanoperedens sp.]
MANVILYSKNGCHLCEVARETLEKIRQEFPFSLTEIDIEKDRTIFEKYKYLIPVIEIDGEPVFKYRINEAEFKRILESKSQPR